MIPAWFTAAVAVLAMLSCLIAAVVNRPLRYWYIGSAFLCLVVGTFYLLVEIGTIHITVAGSVWLRAGQIAMVMVVGLSPWVHRVRR